MSLSMYQASAPLFVTMLNNLAAILEKAEAHAKERNIEESVLLNWRFAPDMFPLTRQVQIAARLSGRPISMARRIATSRSRPGAGSFTSRASLIS